MYEAGDLRGALREYQRLLDRWPCDAELLSDAGAVCFALGRTRQGARYFAKALEVDPEHAEARENLSAVCQAMGWDARAFHSPACEVAAPGGRGRPEVSVVVPVHSRLDVVARCLDALAAQTLPMRAYEVLAVANGVRGQAMSDLRALLAEHGKRFGERLRLVEVEQASIPLARNAGIEAAAGRIVLQMNEDTILPPRALERHHAAHEGFGFSPECVVIGGRQFPEPYRKSLFNYLYESVPLYTPLHRPAPSRRCTGRWFVTCNLSCLREAYARFGVYDPAYDWGSDTALGLRWEREHGLSFYLRTDIVSYHLHWLSFDSWRENCIRRVPTALRLATGLSPDELPPEVHARVVDNLELFRMDMAAFEAEMRRIERDFTGPDDFGPDTFMGETVRDIEEFDERLRPVIANYKQRLHLTELRELLKRKRKWQPEGRVRA